MSTITGTKSPYTIARAGQPALKKQKTDKNIEGIASRSISSITTSSSKVTFKAKKQLPQKELNNSLALAVYQGDAQKVKEYLTKGASVHTSFAKSHNVHTCLVGGSLLGVAAIHGDLEVVKLLLAAGADVNKQANEEEGNRPLHNAICFSNTAFFPSSYKKPQENLKVIELLLEAGADINAVNNHNNTPFFYATEAAIHADQDEYELEKFEPILEALATHGADMQAEDENGRNPVWNAIFYESDEVLLILLQLGAKLSRDIEDI